MTTPALLRMTAPLREDFEIPYHDIGDRAQTPKLALVAGIHGDELNGIFVLSRLANFLHAVSEGRHTGQTLTERVVIVPAVNILGVNIGSRRWPFDSTDINRMFPGYDAGETTQRIAHAVMAVTRPAHYRIDIHSSNSHFEECPQVRLYEPTESERATAHLFGLSAVIELRMNTVFTSTIGHAWRTCGGENFVIQGGQATVLDPGHCERLFRALVAFLYRTGMLHGRQLSAEDDDVHHFGIGQTLPLISEHAGFFVSRLEVGRWLQAGDVIGKVFDGFGGEQRHEVRAPVAGLLSGLRRQALLFEGDLVARIQSRQSVGEGVDTYLHGQGQ
jgi:predicted deacylase